MTDRSEFISNFLNIFPTLTTLQRKILKYLHWFSSKFRCVFPCLQKIANAVGCCTRTVMRCTSYFESLGWLYKKKRGYCSNIYYLNDGIISLDLSDESLFFRRECHSNVTVLRSSLPDNLDISTNKQEVPAQKEQKQTQIPYCIKIRSLSESDQIRLSDEFSEYALQNSIKDAKWYVKMGNEIKNMMAILWSGAKRYS